MNSSIRTILEGPSLSAKKALFLFDGTDTDEEVLLKFNLWARYFFAKYFKSKDAEFHRDRIDLNNVRAYRGGIDSFVDIAFRGAAKTARTKLFVAYAICNDENHFRRFIRVLSADKDNSKQIVTDVYNMLIAPRIKEMYPEVFEKTDKKREESMTSFTTSTGIRMVARTVGTDQRGAIQEESRPDFDWYEDFENRKTLRSGKMTKAIWDNMEEARTGLAKGGSSVYTCNYISESGNVHRLVTSKSSRRVVEIIAITKDQTPLGEPSWPERFTREDIATLQQQDDDFEGERLCKPSASKDVFFDREILDAMPVQAPKREIAGFKLWKDYNPSHRYGSGHDVAGGVGLDSSTSAFIDFTTVPNQVVATFKSNTIKPDVFGDEIKRESDIFGGAIAGIEKNNHGHATIARAKQLEVQLYKTQAKTTRIESSGKLATEYGWLTNGATKSEMLFALAKAVTDGLLVIFDEDLVAELKAYTRDDLIDSEADPRLTTRHFDLLIALAIAWQMRNFAKLPEEKKQNDDAMRMLLLRNKQLKNSLK